MEREHMLQTQAKLPPPALERKWQQENKTRRTVVELRRGQQSSHTCTFRTSSLLILELELEQHLY